MGRTREAAGPRLSPLYDVVPRPRVGHEGRLALSAGTRGHEATLANALSGASWFGLEQGEAVTLLEELRLQVEARWGSRLTKAGVNGRDVKRLANCFMEAGRHDWQ